MEAARALGAYYTPAVLAEPGAREEVGQTPWSAPKPVLVDMARAARELGYRPATTWADAIPRQVGEAHSVGISPCYRTCVRVWCGYGDVATDGDR